MNWKCLIYGHDWDLGARGISKCRRCGRWWSHWADTSLDIWIVALAIVVAWLAGLLLPACF